MNGVSGVIGVYLRILSTSLTLASYSSKLLFLETLKTSTTYAETQEHLFIERFCFMLFEEQHRKFFIFYGTDHNPQSVRSKRVANGRAS